MHIEVADLQKRLVEQVIKFLVDIERKRKEVIF
jgi:hypothetical protein